MLSTRRKSSLEFFEEETAKAAKPYCDVLGEGRQLLAYAVWYQHDQNPLWQRLAEKKIHRLAELTQSKEGTFYYRKGRGYTPGESAEGTIIPIADHGVYDVEKGMTGSPAAYMVGFIPQACANWSRLIGDRSLLDLGGGLANYLVRYGEMLDPDFGHVLADHDAHVAHCLLSNLAFALTAQDPEMIKWVKKGFDYYVKHREQRDDPDRLGILLADPTCSCFVSSMVDTALLLTQAGYGNYWEKIDRWVRNTVVNQQVQEADVEAIKALPIDNVPHLEPAWYRLEDGPDRCLGTWCHSLTVRNRSIGCCNGDSPRMLYFIWHNIVTFSDEQLRVNLLLNRPSPWVDIDSYLPFKGKVVIHVKEKCSEFLIRIPEWTDWNAVDCSLNGKSRKYRWSKSHIDIGRVKKGDTVTVTFPLRHRTVKTSSLGKSCQVEIKGNTIVDINPDVGLSIVTRNHEKYRSRQAPMKKSLRFVSTERFLW